MPMMKEMPLAERPRERLFERGGQYLSNTELIALLIGSGTRGVSAVSLAGRVLAMTGDGIAALKGASREELLQVKGVGEASASRILAAVELGVRIAAANTDGRTRVTVPDDVYEMLAPEFVSEKQEVMTVLLLNTKYEVIGREMVTKGGIAQAHVDARDVFRPAVRRGATGVILVHNHPSGDPSPSDDDIKATEKLVEAGETIGVPLVDHIIIGRGKFASLRGLNMIKS